MRFVIVPYFDGFVQRCSDELEDVGTESQQRRIAKHLKMIVWMESISSHTLIVPLKKAHTVSSRDAEKLDKLLACKKEEAERRKNMKVDSRNAIPSIFCEQSG